GTPLPVLYANFKDNYEDAIIISDIINTKKILSHKSVIFHPLPRDVPSPEIDTILDHSHYWWRPYDKGRVVAQGVSKTKYRYVVAEMKCDIVRVGDKLATHHGQKFSVSRVVPHDQMPKCRDTVTGE